MRPLHARIRRIVQRLTRRSRGFTLVEMMSVMAILSALSAVTFPAVAGTTTIGKSTTQTVDISSIQRAADWFASESLTQNHPTDASLPGATATWTSGQVPTVHSSEGSGDTPASPKTFSQEHIAAINFSSQQLVGGAVKIFNRDYLRSEPEHAASLITVGPNSTSPTFRTRKQASDFYVRLRNTTASALQFNAWGMDANGEVWIFVDRDSY